MQEWLNEQLARGFADFKGSTITGAIPVKEELINRLIAEYLARGGQEAAPRTDRVDIAPLLRFVRSATVHAEPGVVTLRFEAGV
jgi:hypothetical protein